MFPDLEFIKTCLNGLRSRIEKVENWVVSFMRTNRPNWAQNDPEALDYVKGRTHYDQRVITTVTGTIAYATMQPYPISNEIWKALLTKEATVQCVLGTYVYDYTSGDWVYYRNTSNAGKLEIMATSPQARFSLISGLTLPSSPNVIITVPSGQLKQLDSKFLPVPTADTAGAIKADAAETTDIRPVRLGADGKLYSSGIPIFTTSGTGSSYKADVPEITELVNGMLVVMVPHVTSTTSAPMLTISGLRSCQIRRFIGSQADTAITSTGKYTNWLKANAPVLLMYTSGCWVACNFTKPDADDLYGYVPVSSGGTGWGRLTAGSYLVGNETSTVLLKTPSEVLADIGAIPAPPSAKVGQTIVVKAVDENGKPTEWEAADMTSGVQPDWNQNDAAQPDYVKSRPFYTGGPVETTFVEDSTVSFTRNEYSGFYLGSLQSTFVATAGETYKVSWDGTTYESTCADSNGKTIIGNLSIMGAGSDTGEPFIMMVQNRVGIEIATADTSASHTFSISGFAQEVVKIDRKYLPKAASIIYDSSNSTYNSDLTYDELYEILLNGEQIVLYRTSVNRYFYLMMWAKKSNGEINLSFDGKEFQITLFPDGTIDKTPVE